MSSTPTVEISFGSLANPIALSITVHEVTGRFAVSVKSIPLLEACPAGNVEEALLNLPNLPEALLSFQYVSGFFNFVCMKCNFMEKYYRQ